MTELLSKPKNDQITPKPKKWPKYPQNLKKIEIPPKPKN